MIDQKSFQPDDRLSEFTQSARESPLHLSDGCTMSIGGVCLHQIPHTLSLHEIELSVQVGALSELSGSRLTSTGPQTGCEDHGREEGSPMEGELRHILPGIGSGSSETGKECSIQLLTAGRIDQGNEAMRPRRGKYPSQHRC
jgi:hypothetical protein